MPDFFWVYLLLKLLKINSNLKFRILQQGGKDGREKRGFPGSQPVSHRLSEPPSFSHRSFAAACPHKSHAVPHVTKLTRADSSRTCTAEICRKEAFGGRGETCHLFVSALILQSSLLFPLLCLSCHDFP